jgi:beta-phosphoglucomutase
MLSGSATEASFRRCCGIAAVVFLTACTELKLQPEDCICIVFEDVKAGGQAGQAAGMKVVGIGKPEVLKEADLVVAGLHVL